MTIRLTYDDSHTTATGDPTAAITIELGQPWSLDACHRAGVSMDAAVNALDPNGAAPEVGRDVLAGVAAAVAGGGDRDLWSSTSRTAHVRGEPVDPDQVGDALADAQEGVEYLRPQQPNDGPIRQAWPPEAGPISGAFPLTISPPGTSLRDIQPGTPVPVYAADEPQTDGPPESALRGADRTLAVRGGIQYPARPMTSTPAGPQDGEQVEPEQRPARPARRRPSGGVRPDPSVATLGNEQEEPGVYRDALAAAPVDPAPELDAGDLPQPRDTDELPESSEGPAPGR